MAWRKVYFKKTGQKIKRPKTDGDIGVQDYPMPLTAVGQVERGPGGDNHRPDPKTLSLGRPGASVSPERCPKCQSRLVSSHSELFCLSCGYRPQNPCRQPTPEEKSAVKRGGGYRRN